MNGAFIHARYRLGHPALVAFLLLLPATASVARAEDYGAIAYSPSTGNYGYSYRYRSRAQAEQVALSHCKAQDAEILTWVRGNWWCCLVLDLDGAAYAWGWGRTWTAARDKALPEIEKYTDNYYIPLYVSADGAVHEFDPPMRLLRFLPKPKDVPPLPEAFFPAEEP